MTCGKGTKNHAGGDCMQPSTVECTATLSCMITEHFGLLLLLWMEICIIGVGYATHLAKLGVAVTQHPQNTNRFSRPMTLLINGIPTTVQGQRIFPTKCASTGQGDNPWVRLDLKKAYLVSLVRVIIYGTTAQNVAVRVGNSLTNNGNDNHQCGMVVHVWNNRHYAVWRDVTCSPPVWGRYINFDRTVQNHFLEICEAVFEYGQQILCCHQHIYKIAVMVLLLQMPVWISEFKEVVLTLMDTVSQCIKDKDCQHQLTVLLLRTLPILVFP